MTTTTSATVHRPQFDTGRAWRTVSILAGWMAGLLVLSFAAVLFLWAVGDTALRLMGEPKPPVLWSTFLGIPFSVIGVIIVFAVSELLAGASRAVAAAWDMAE